MHLTYIPLPVMTASESFEPVVDCTECLKQAQAFAYALVDGDCTGHDRFHLERVRHMALRLAQGSAETGLDLLVIDVAAILHDALDSKFCDNLEEQKKRVTGLLESMPMLPKQREHVLAIISGIGFVHSLRQADTSELSADTSLTGLSFEGQIVHDADKLDALGAIGIARCFAFGGRKGQPLHDPDLQPREQLTAQGYRQGKQSSLNHFHEKLLKLKDMLHTPAARRIAEKRHAYLQDFLARFDSEWNGIA